jgi:hypothetical protein
LKSTRYLRSTSHEVQSIVRGHRATVLFGVAAVLYTLLRVPSFLEPHWYTDEAGYITTAREMLRGKVLYLEIWNNKPPLQLWTVAAALWAFGSSEAGLHAVTYVFGLVTLSAATYAACRLLKYHTAVVVVSIIAVLLGTPLFDAELLIPESLLIAPSTWAGALLLVRLQRPGPATGWIWPLPIGVLAAVATAYQQTCIADFGAFFLILVVSPKTRLRHLIVFVVAYVAVTATWLVPSILLAGLAKVAFALAGFYIPYTTSELPRDPILTGILIGSILAPSILIIIGAWLGRSQPFPWAAAIWCVAALLAAGAPLHPYPHLALPAVVPGALAVACLWERIGFELRTLTRVRLSTIAVAAAVLIAGAQARGAGLDWIPPLSSNGANQSRALSDYYGGLAQVGVGRISVASWGGEFDSRVEPDALVASWLQAHGLAGSRAVIWSSDSWLYELADLDDVLPTPPIYNNFQLLGDTGEVTDFVGAQHPDVVVTADEDLVSFPEILALLTNDYVQVFSAGEDRVWIPKVN